MEPSGLMAASRFAAKKEESRQPRQRKVIDSSEQWASPTTADADVGSPIRRLPSHLQSLVISLAKMASPSEEGKLKEKRRKDAFKQATSMMVVISVVA